MSSTGRKEVRFKDDAYMTPCWVVNLILDELKAEISPRATFLEPCAGTGAVIEATRVYFPAAQWSAVELREECRAKLSTLVDGDLRIGNYLELAETFLNVDVIITNPPYKYAMEFVQASLPKAKLVAMLLRLNFVGSADRSDFMRTHAPDLYSLPNRPSFNPELRDTYSTDSVEYAWFVWRNGGERPIGCYKCLPTTPKGVRIKSRTSTTKGNRNDTR